jgi:hypothetical protein
MDTKHATFVTTVWRQNTDFISIQTKLSFDEGKQLQIEQGNQKARELNNFFGRCQMVHCSAFTLNPSLFGDWGITTTTTSMQNINNDQNSLHVSSFSSYPLYANWFDIKTERLQMQMHRDPLVYSPHVILLYL